MNNPFNRTQELRLACPNFSASEVDALRCLLQLIKPYLKQHWEVVDSAGADLFVVNMDLPQPAVPTGIPVVGCAQRPRLHAMGTLHRPLRVAEVLALLTEVGAKNLPATTTAADGNLGIEWHYELRAWPLDFQQWPRAAWRVLAIMSGATRSVAEIANHAGLPNDEVERYIAMAQRADLVNRYGERRTLPLQATQNWRGLATRVGQLLGFK